MSEPKLLPCPFCGGGGRVTLDAAVRGGWIAWCQVCGCTIHAMTNGMACKNWNRRALPIITPTEPGWYWYRAPANRPNVVEVAYCPDKGLCVFSSSGKATDLKFFTGQFRGPVPNPWSE